MALVAYSDSEGSDAEPDTIQTSSEIKKTPDTTGFKVDRSNPRRIRVALPEIKPEDTPDKDAGDGPARKKARMGGTGGAFSGFNALLPAPKRQHEKKAPIASSRKVFSLKTGAAPGFSREADAELRQEQFLNDPANGNESVEDETIPKAGSVAQPDPESDSVPAPKAIGEVKLQGNPMMFRPLSVGRQKKKKPVNVGKPVASTPTSTATPIVNAQSSAGQEVSTKPTAPRAGPAPPKKKLKLFSFSSEDSDSRGVASTSESTYEPLMYKDETEADVTPAGLETSYENKPTQNAYPTTSSVSSSLDNIANDLNLSKSERRQLFGRNAPSANSQILTFNTDQEYASNQALAESELAGTQHNPVRAVAHGGKTSLQQLVNAASTQKEALEESFATGRRNKKEAGSKYGW